MMRRRGSMGRLGRLLALGGLVAGALVLTGACKDLSSFTLGVCGNSVLERGEDCEPNDKNSDATKAGYCAPKGDPNECHYVCKAGVGCPEHERCGVDGVCRAAGLTFTQASAPVPAKAVAIHVGDFDGDGRADVLASKTDAFDLYFSAGRDLGAPVSLPADPAEGVAVGYLNHDVAAGDPATAPRERADIVVGSGAALGALLGDASRQLSVAAVPSYTFGNDARILAGPSRGVPQSDPVLKDDTEVEGVMTGAADFSMVLKAPDGQLELLQGPGGGAFPAAPLALSSKTELARLVERPTRCDEIVLTAPSQGTVFVVYPCTRSGSTDVPNTLGANPGAIQIHTTGAAMTGPAIVADVFDLAQGKPGKDGHLDVLLPTTSGFEVAPGDGTDTYPGLSGSTVTAVSFCPSSNAPPLCDVIAKEGLLAIADLNADGVDDLVTRTDVELSEPGGYYQAAYPTLQPWAEAIVGDFNGDGRLDVAATPADERKGLEVMLSSAGSYLNPTVIPATNHVGLLTLGDYDGDGIDDIVARVAAAGAMPTCARQDDIVAFFGRASGGVEPGRVVGHLAGVNQIVSGRLPRLDRTDSIFDFGVESDCPEDTVRRVTVFYGTGDRLLDAPFLITDQAGPMDVPEVLAYRPSVIALPSGTLGQAPAAEVTIGMLASYVGGESKYPHEAAQLFIESSPVGSLFKTGHVIHIGSSFNESVASHSALAVGELDGDPEAEVVLWVPAGDAESASHLLLVNDYACVPDSSNGNTPAGCSTNLPSLTSIDLPDIKLADVDHAEILFADLDGDGRDDLVLDVKHAGTGRLFFLQNSAAGLGSAAPVEIANLSAIAVAPISPDPSALATDARALLVAGTTPAGSGVYELSFTGGSPTPKLVPGLTFSGDGAGGLAVGDVDGDGLEDVAILDNQAVGIFYRDTVVAGTVAETGGAK